jgi:asparagine synthase (glutamine-hydrolysing)
MCGIGGIIDRQLTRNQLEAVLCNLQRDLHHRGPDDTGTYVSAQHDVGLVNTRLAILDLSRAGHQPMSTPDGRYHIVLNGEIYNFAALRAELSDEGYRFRSHCDTEVVLAMFERYGPDCVREFVGMFAVAIWDAAEEKLFLARDPMGIKPLYYHADGRRLVFASEVRALLNTGLVPRQLSAAAVSGYLLFGAVQDPMTLIDGVLALPAGHYLVWENGAARLKKFWDVQFGSEPMSQADATELTRRALDESVARHLVSDVPVGFFLSGGADSTALLALAAKRNSADFRTFSISFNDEALNEGDVAARTAQYLRAQHVDWRMAAGAGRDLLQEFMARSDLPSIDGFNTFCVSKLAHDHGLKVVLSGLGGDEIFGGYASFKRIPQMVKAGRLLYPARPFFRMAAGAFDSELLPVRYRRFVRFLGKTPVSPTAYWAMRGIFDLSEVARLLPRYGCVADESVTSLPLHVPPQPTLQDEVSYLEVTRYMRNQLLRDSDVMSMAWGMELRVPFVDCVLLETVQKIPAALRLAVGKQMLLDAVPEIPAWVRTRPKQGFTFPFARWATGQWSDVFERIEAESPVRLGTWYRCWCLFALDNFVERHALGKLSKAA